MVATNLGRYMVSRFTQRFVMPIVVLLGLKTSEEGAQTSVYCAVASELQDTPVGFFRNCAQEPWTEQSLDSGVGKKLWEVSERLTGLAGDERA